MKIRKRYILLIVLSILPFYKIIHFGDYCINDVDYLIIAFLSIVVLVSFLSIALFNLYNISIRRELFNYRPYLIFAIFLVALYVGIKMQGKEVLKDEKHQFSIQISDESFAEITLYNDKTVRLKTNFDDELCVQKGTYIFKNDTLLIIPFNAITKNEVFDTSYNFNKEKESLEPFEKKLPKFTLNE